MRLVHLDDVELIVRKTVRSTIDYRSLLTGTPGAIDNFKLILGTTHADYTTPRHRHNFDQIRLQVGGNFDYDGLGTMTEGMGRLFPGRHALWTIRIGRGEQDPAAAACRRERIGISLRRRIQCEHCRAETEGRIPRRHLHDAEPRRSQA
jgi:hypothetical protein